jgi:hypothetical protein
MMVGESGGYSLELPPEPEEFPVELAAVCPLPFAAGWLPEFEHPTRLEKAKLSKTKTIAFLTKILIKTSQK